MKRILLTAVLAAACTGAFAQQPPQATQVPQNVESAGTRVGLGQDSAREPAKIKNLRLSDPLVQQKYLNEPDMLRFLRGTYSEACARGLVKNAADSIWLDTKNQYTTDQKAMAKQLVESNRIWKMTSFEMEALYGAGYLNAANYCDCIMKEVSDQDLVNPRKGLDAVEQISKPAQTACQQNAKETTDREMAERKKNEKKN